MRKIFICYRRADNRAICERLCDHLVNRFGRESVVKDVDTFSSGKSFRDEAEQLISESAVQLVIIGQEWLLPSEETLRPRIESKDDMVRFEIETALKVKTHIIPILIDNANMPKAHELPPAIRDLADLNALLIRNDPDFSSDIDRLIATIEFYQSLPVENAVIVENTWLSKFDGLIDVCGSLALMEKVNYLSYEDLLVWFQKNRDLFYEKTVASTLWVSDEEDKKCDTSGIIQAITDLKKLNVLAARLIFFDFIDPKILELHKNARLILYY